jgi:hypothetical protein
MTLAAGNRLGPYEIVAPLSAGEMGEVYRARDTRLGRASPAIFDGRAESRPRLPLEGGGLDLRILGAKPACFDAEGYRHLRYGGVGGNESESFSRRDSEVQRVERAECESEARQPVAGELIVTALDWNSCIETVLNVDCEAKKDLRGVFDGQLSKTDLPRKRRAEFHFCQVADRRAGVGSDESFGAAAQRFRRVVGDDHAGVEVDQ